MPQSGAIFPAYPMRMRCRGAGGSRARRPERKIVRDRGRQLEAREILPRHLADPRRDPVRLHQDPAGVGGDDGELAGAFLGDAGAILADLVEVRQVGVGAGMELAVREEQARGLRPAHEDRRQARAGRIEPPHHLDRLLQIEMRPPVIEMLRLEDGDALPVLDVRDDDVAS